MKKNTGISVYTPITAMDSNCLYTLHDDVSKAPEPGTIWQPQISELLYMSVEQTYMPDPENGLEYYILKKIETVATESVLLFTGNKTIAVTGWDFEFRETYYEKEWFSIKNAACFVYNGTTIYLLYEDYVGLWNKGKYLAPV